MNTARCATNMGALACVFFEMRSFYPNTNIAWQDQKTIDVERLVVLTNLICLGHIGVEIVLAMKS